MHYDVCAPVQIYAQAYLEDSESARSRMRIVVAMREQQTVLLLDVVQCWIEHGQNGKALTSGHVCRSTTRFT